MKTIKTTEKFDADGKLIERVTETTETIETAPVVPWTTVPYWPYPQPVTTPVVPDYTPQITYTCSA